jgi:hypothetical protein
MVAICALVALVASPCAALSGSLTDLFRSPQFARLELAPLGSALASTVASTYPVASASSSVLYAYNPATDTFKRSPGGLGPIFGERAETLGRGQMSFDLTYSFVDLATINGKSLEHLVNVPSVKGRFLFFHVAGGVTLKDGRFTTLLPVRAALDLDVNAHIVAPSVTYGLTPDLDVNLTVPVLSTSLGIRARTRVPDPRLAAFMLPAGDSRARVDVLSESATSEGVGDVLLRGKYVLHRGGPVDLAAGLGLSLPSGHADDFQGTGTTQVQPELIASRVVADRLELLANAGIDLDADAVERSVVRWAIGGTVRPIEQVAVPIVIFGRHELSAPAARIPVPFFFQIERSDSFDASVGVRWRFARAAVLSANALVPLDRAGLRAEVIPSVQMEYGF